MIEVNSAMIAAFGGIGAIALALVGMWVTLNNNLTRNSVKIEDLEVRTVKVENTLDDHDNRINEALGEIKDGIHRIELQIANNKRNDAGK